jgi:hypothetical protein
VIGNLLLQDVISNGNPEHKMLSLSEGLQIPFALLFLENSFLKSAGSHFSLMLQSLNRNRQITLAVLIP